LLSQLVADGNGQIIEKDSEGAFHFNGNFNNAKSLDEALNGLSNTGYGPLIDQEREKLLEIFEEVFDHKSFTGRSGTFFGFEGLGSIYWHMVSKLLLAVMECCAKAIETNADKKIIARLAQHYHEINEGIGAHKSPELYGAFPTDPYSHTPAHKGAQQPGMTGQVKEDILSRMAEMGVAVKEGSLRFSLGILSMDEFLTESTPFTFIDVDFKKQELNLEKDSLCFTYCQIPVVYKLSNKQGLRISFSDKTIESDELTVDEATSKAIFERTGDVKKIEVSFTK
ncbi:MAG: hypothetical protein HKM92_02375, partial [Arenibacter sp.]|nr:hypothetical protein [Arenibacter sp.]